MQAKTTDPKAATEGELKSRELTRYLPVCNFEQCEWNPDTLIDGKPVPPERRPQTRQRREVAIRAAADHAVSSGHVMVKQVKVRKIRQVVREEIVG